MCITGPEVHGENSGGQAFSEFYFKTKILVLIQQYFYSNSQLQLATLYFFSTMESAKVLNKLLKEAPKDSKGSKEIEELRNLIIELMKPRLGQLLQILKTRMIASTRDEFQDENEDWWPDYELLSADWRAFTDMNVSKSC